MFFFGGEGIGGGGRGRVGGQGGCDRRLEVFGKIHKKWGGGRGGWVGGDGLVWGFRVDVNEELKFFCENSKKIGGGGAGGWVGLGGGVGVGVHGGCERRIEVFGKIHKKNRRGVSGGKGVRWVGSGWWGVRVDVNAMLGVGGDVGYGGCEPRIEGIVQCT